MGSKNRFFAIFLKCVALIFLKIAYDGSLEQCLITSRSETHKKNVRAKWVNIGPQISFFFNHFKFSLVFLEIAYYDSLEHRVTTSKGKTHGKYFRDPKLGPKLVFLPFYQGCIINFP